MGIKLEALLEQKFQKKQSLFPFSITSHLNLHEPMIDLKINRNRHGTRKDFFFVPIRINLR
ncbi:hypothetical protein A7K93_08815 [Candidatus Methylacidiphilum fumarolicum]|uniref:Uncharacterized protein n=2 Tax=Candidatus Methylacidiphilum fumarolicum TaxID=591154 RepID=I0JXE3_METFB|nr:hypothetical protein A7K72_09075 [Candidatus Methylacidiphilum fumarolicum]TFE72330.1 hypothetical protein A7K93_08815 [Candidatus Methylacidiphilum fumarolicum]CAI9086233.1 conserved protein of unknown function [Candidatus Methylacidiphilum fumarolicum]CCG91912.1 hypothetical protein MFUM_270009 [Methylacidiphilum fumariolicum SolV]